MSTFKKYLISEQDSAINNQLIQVPGIGKMLVGQIKAKVYGMVENILDDIAKSGRTDNPWTIIQSKLNNDALQIYVATLAKIEQ